MTTLQKGTLWMVGCLVLVFGLSIALSWYFYGYLEMETLIEMGGMLLPILGVASLVLFNAETRPARTPPRAQARPRRIEPAGMGKE